MTVIWPKVALKQSSKNTNFEQAYLLTPLTDSHETMPTYASPHGEQICYKNLCPPSDRCSANFNQIHIKRGTMYEGK